MQKIKEVLKQFDLFSAQPTLRARSESEVVNACGGLLSLLVLGCSAYLFFSQLSQVVNWQKINSVYTQTNNLQSQATVNQFPIGIGVEGFPLSEALRYVRFQFIQVTMKSITPISIRVLKQEPCQISHFSALQDQAQENYNNYNLANKICLSPNQTYSIQQQQTQTYKMLAIQVNSCKRLNQDNSSMYTGCASDEQFFYGNQFWIRQYKYFTVLSVFINTAFNPTSKVSTNKFMDVIRQTFTLTSGVEAFIYLSTYTVNTDTNIFPWENTITQSGYVLDRKEQSNFQSVIYFENINILVLISSKQKQYDRTLGKIDEVLSYAGGLFGIIISFLSFFLISFNQYRYELIVGEGAFNYSDSGHKMTENDFNFLQYLKFSLYDWIKVFTCHEMQWRNCKEVEETREEANNQLDVKLLFRKIQHFEKVIEYLISDKENISIYLTEPPSLEEVKRERRIAEYYDKVIKGKAAATVEDFQSIENVFNFAMFGGGIMNTNEQESKTQFAVAATNSKRKLNDKIDASRENILERVLQNQNYKKELDIDDVDLNEEEQQLELQIAQAFYRMPEIARNKIQQKIPIKILHRLKQKYEYFIQKCTVNIQI